MKAAVWIRIAGKKSYGRWEAGQVHISKTKPAYRRNEVALRLDVVVPDAIFDDPVFEAKVELPEPHLTLPNAAEVASNVGAVLSQQMGFQVKVSVTDPQSVATA